MRAETVVRRLLSFPQLVGRQGRVRGRRARWRSAACAVSACPMKSSAPQDDRVTARAESLRGKGGGCRPEAEETRRWGFLKSGHATTQTCSSLSGTHTNVRRAVLRLS